MPRERERPTGETGGAQMTGAANLKSTVTLRAGTDTCTSPGGAERFERAVLTDAFLAGWAATYTRRADALTWARPRAGDFTGHSTAEDRRKAWRRLTEQAIACRRHAGILTADADVVGDTLDDALARPGCDAVTDAIPWASDRDLAEHDAATAERSYDDQLDMDVAREVRRIRINEAARARVQAENAAHVDYGPLYLDRAGLLDLPAPDSLIDRVLPRHAYGLLRGRDGTLKSFVALDWACSLATGKPWQGHAVDAVRVLYIAGEGAHGLSARVDAWEHAWGRSVPPQMLTVRSTALNLHRPGPAFDHLLDHVRTGRYGLVVVDTSRRVSGAADGNSSEMGLVVDNLDRIRQATADGSVLAVAHTDKLDRDTRGYSGIEDDADFVWAARREDMRLTLELTKMKDGPDGRVLDLEAVRTLGSLTLQGTSGPAESNTNDSQLRLLDTLRDLFPDGVGGSELRTTAGLPKTSFYRALRDLLAAGHVVNTGTRKGPFYELSASSTSPVKESR